MKNGCERRAGRARGKVGPPCTPCSNSYFSKWGFPVLQLAWLWSIHVDRSIYPGVWGHGHLWDPPTHLPSKHTLLYAIDHGKRLRHCHVLLHLSEVPLPNDSLNKKWLESFLLFTRYRYPASLRHREILEEQQSEELDILHQPLYKRGYCMLFTLLRLILCSLNHSLNCVFISFFHNSISCPKLGGMA